MRSYFSEDKLADVKTGTLIAEARDIDYILVDNEKEALALENNLIKQYKPRFNILLRDDKTYPYIKLTNEKYPRVYVTRRLRKDGSTYYGPYFPANLAHRLVHFIHRHFKVPSCKVDLTRFHPKPCLQYHIHRCLGPCVQGLTTDDAYAAAVRDVRLFLEGRHKDLARELRDRMEAASRGDALRGGGRPARPASPRWKRSKSGRRWRPPRATTSTSSRVYAEPPLVALNLFHLRNGHIVDRREFFWEDQFEFDPAEFFSLAAQADLSGPAVHPGRDPRAGGLRRPRGAGRTAQRKARPQGRDPHAAARTEEGHAGPGGDQRQTQLRRALPRAEAVLARDPGGAAGRAESAGSRPRASSASTSRTFRAPTRSPAWWCGKTAG